MSLTPGTPVIAAHQVCRSFGDIQALQDLNLVVQQGEVFGLLGHNGAGKTTTIRLLNGVLRPDHGTIEVLGFNPIEQGEALRSLTGVLTETPSVDDRLSGWENLELYARLYGVDEARVAGRVTELLDQFGLLERAPDRVSGYSRGMRQRLALARALVHDPQVLFLDEPTAALDPVASRQVHQLISGLRREGRTIVICTHNLDEAQRLCDRVAILEHGRVIAMGKVRELGQMVTGTSSLEIEVALDDLERAEAVLSSSLSEIDVRVDRNMLIVGGILWEHIPDTVRSLTQAGVQVFAVRPEEPSLEDVYFQLHEGQTEGSQA